MRSTPTAELSDNLNPSSHHLRSQNGQRTLVERFPDVCVLHAEVVGFSGLVSHADTSECILTLNRIFCSFDKLTDKHAVHKVWVCLGTGWQLGVEESTCLAASIW